MELAENSFELIMLLRFGKINPEFDSPTIHTLRTIQRVTKLTPALVRSVCFSPLLKHLPHEFNSFIDAFYSLYSN